MQKALNRKISTLMHYLRLVEEADCELLFRQFKNFKVHNISRIAGNLKEHQATLEFMLLRGSYATVLLREIMKPKNPIKAGF